MKKSFLILTMICLSLGAFSQAKSRAIKVNPLRLAFGTVKVSYEQAVSEKSSGQFGVSLINIKIGSTTISGFGLHPEFRFYSNQALDRFYVAPLLNYSAITGKDSGEEVSTSVFGGGGKIGWNWLIGSSNSFVIDLGLGFQYLAISAESNNSSVDFEKLNGALPIVNLSIGYAF